jgi:site-specific DNA-methyltransferase (cytosine-N4-specific)
MLNIKQHPARFPEELPEFFINFLTEEGDIVLDIFAGSNTVGYVAEKMKRRWLAFDVKQEYLVASMARFVSVSEFKKIYQEISSGKIAGGIYLKPLI